MADMFIPVLLGTAREGRQSEKVARYVLEQVRSYGLDSELVDVRDYVTLATIPWWDHPAEAKPWSEIMQRAAGLIIVTPEYNHGYPGELKIMLDKLYKEYEGKPVAVCGVSSGGLGGARGVEHLKHVLLKYMMFPMRTGVYFSNVVELFDEDGRVRDDSFDERVKKMLDELIEYVGRMIRPVMIKL